MPFISPLSSPELYLDTTEIPVPAGPQPITPKRLTQDLETEGLLPVVTPESSFHNDWSFLDQSDYCKWLDQIEAPFNENGDPLPLPSKISQNSSTSDSLDSSPQAGSEGSGDTREPQSHLVTPVRQETREREVLSDTIELGNCTYDKLNSVTKTNTTVTKLNISHSVYTCNVSSTPLNVKAAASNLTSDLITSEPITPGFGRKSVLERGLTLDPIAPPKQLDKQQKKKISTSNNNDSTLPQELAIKPADSTVDLDNEEVLDDILPDDIHPENPDNPLELMKPHPPPVKEKMTPTPKRRNSTILREQKSSFPGPRQKQPLKSTLPVVANRPSQRGGNGPRLLHGMRQASSTSTLPQRSSLLPTAMKSRSHERINATVTSTTKLKHKK